jgi:hypothetical protein
MIKRFFLLLTLAVLIVGCQFTETLELNENGTGRMTIEMDLDEMMAFTDEFGKDSVATKMDTIIHMKDFLEEKKDSISKLSEDKQKQLKKMENYNLHMIMDTDKSEMKFNIFSDFKDISEVDDLFKGLEQTASLMPGLDDDGDEKEEKEEESKDIIGVSYSYKDGRFKRDAYIKDKELHQKEVDSMKSAESFMSSMTYRLKYTFPRKIKKASVENASYSLDGRTIEIVTGFVEYFKDPDVLDLEIELEK